ncbi:hypothetical protein IHE44_0003427 [Lamprotornis superbus]|uniref:Uncharacterized protein n=1 Tax=Lamprotornis superbus TaxID=245042 RepID=A0A835NRL8_9PASS|nr:hypothetical protein IHE44_0003427 [Lamprotornis superbus]
MAKSFKNPFCCAAKLGAHALHARRSELQHMEQHGVLAARSQQIEIHLSADTSPIKRFREPKHERRPWRICGSRLA